MLLINRRLVLATGGTLAATLIARKPRAEELDDVAEALKPTNPPVAAPNVAFQSRDGAEHHLADFLGHGMVINLWATWCVPCVEEMPSLAKLSKALAPDDIAVLPLSSDRGGAGRVEAFYQQHAITRAARAARIRAAPQRMPGTCTAFRPAWLSTRRGARSPGWREPRIGPRRRRRDWFGSWSRDKATLGRDAIAYSLASYCPPFLRRMPRRMLAQMQEGDAADKLFRTADWRSATRRPQSMGSGLSQSASASRQHYQHFTAMVSPPRLSAGRDGIPSGLNRDRVRSTMYSRSVFEAAPKAARSAGNIHTKARPRGHSRADNS